MAKKKRHHENVLSKVKLINSPPNTKTVWGLTKEEIEFSAYLYCALGLAVLATDLVYIMIGLSGLVSQIKGANNIIVPMLLLVLSSIQQFLGVSGIYYENRITLTIAGIFGIFNIFVYLFAVIKWPFIIMGTILILILTLVQLIISGLLLMSLVLHKEIFKKEVVDWMEESFESLTLSQSSIDILSSDLGLNDSSTEDKPNNLIDNNKSIDKQNEILTTDVQQNQNQMTNTKDKTNTEQNV